MEGGKYPAEAIGSAFIPTAAVWAWLGSTLDEAGAVRWALAADSARGWGVGTERVLSKALNGTEMTINGRAPNAGEIFKNPGLAKTLRAVGEGGAARGGRSALGGLDMAVGDDQLIACSTVKAHDEVGTDSPDTAKASDLHLIALGSRRLAAHP